MHMITIGVQACTRMQVTQNNHSLFWNGMTMNIYENNYYYCEQNLRAESAPRQSQQRATLNFSWWFSRDEALWTAGQSQSKDIWRAHV